MEGGSEEGGEKSPSADSGNSSGSGGVSSLASFVVPWWHLKIAIYHLTPVDTAEGVRSVRSHVITIGPLRCAPNQAAIKFELPNGGLSMRGDVQISLISASGLLAADDELGWTHVHTSWLPEGPEVTLASEDAPADGEEAVHEPVHRIARLGKGDVDLVSKDGRFAPEWSMALEYSEVAPAVLEVG